MHGNWCEEWSIIFADAYSCSEGSTFSKTFGASSCIFLFKHVHVPLFASLMHGLHRRCVWCNRCKEAVHFLACTHKSSICEAYTYVQPLHRRCVGLHKSKICVQLLVSSHWRCVDTTQQAGALLAPPQTEGVASSCVRFACRAPTGQLRGTTQLLAVP